MYCAQRRVTILSGYAPFYILEDYIYYNVNMICACSIV